MLRFAFRRIIQMFLILFAISIITFLIFNVVPGGGSKGAVLRIAGRSSNETTRAQIRHDFGFDRPVYVQYWKLMDKTVSGELESYSNRVNVKEEIVRGLPATISLVVGAAIIWLFFGILFGVISARYAGRWPDVVLGAVSMV